MSILNIFKKSKNEIIKEYIIEFPFRGVIEADDLANENGEDEYILGKDVYQFLDKDSIDGINASWNTSNMQEFINNKNIKNKISGMKLSIKDSGICHIYIQVFEELTVEEKEYILNFVRGQASDGWGEGDFDYIYDKVNKQLFFYWGNEEKLNDKNCISFSLHFWWNDSNWYIKYIDI